MKGPYDCGEDTDLGVFRKPGLKERLQQLGKRAIADGIYIGESEFCSTYNSHDSRAVHMFKSRALKRHETFNDLIKFFECMSDRFRHSKERFAASFEAVCVVCQYKIENEVPLFDILVEAVINADDDDDERSDFEFNDEQEEGLSDEDEE